MHESQSSAICNAFPRAPMTSAGEWLMDDVRRVQWRSRVCGEQTHARTVDKLFCFEKLRSTADSAAQSAI